MGRAWYIGAIFILVVATVTVAMFLSHLMKAAKEIGIRLLHCLRFITKIRLRPPGGGLGGAIPPPSDATSADEDRSPRHPSKPPGGGGAMSGILSTSGSNNCVVVSEVSALPSHQRTLQQATAGWASWAARILNRRRHTNDFADDFQQLERVQVYGGGKESV